MFTLTASILSDCFDLKLDQSCEANCSIRSQVGSIRSDRDVGDVVFYNLFELCFSQRRLT